MTGLFANQRQLNLTSTIQMIEHALRALEHDPAACRLPAAGDDQAAWEFVHGSALTRIQLEKDEAGDPFLRVASIVMTLDDSVDRLALFTHLLAHNRKLCGLSLALDEDRIELAGERPCRDLDRSEVDDLLRHVSRRADQLDDELVARFGGHRGRRA
jgi:site-specific recombinase